MAESANQTSFDSMVGRLVVERGLATSDDVQTCLDRLRQLHEAGNASDRTLTDVLVEEGMVTRRQIDRIRTDVDDQRATPQQIPGYQILAKLGAGAMATVYKAKQLSLDRLVAIKVLPRKYTNNADFVKRFYAEGRAAARLNHPNIVGALDVGQAGEYHYFVMEYVEGRTVFDDITELGPYSEDEALDIAIQVTKALHHAHKAGFIHRDVKPKNIMLTQDGVAKLADMGLARAVSDREAAEAEQGKAFGTPYYISPEQIRGEREVDHRADIYCLGATLYHMITGQVPFDGPNPSSVMYKHLKEELVPPDHIRPELSTGLCEIVELCMAKRVTSRYQEAADLLTDLEQVKRGEAPTMARRAFDMAALSTLEDQGDQTAKLVRLDDPDSEHLTAQPLFWIAVAGWVVAFLLFLLMLLTMLGG